ncbi:MAG: sulfatase-like hydrolase/transferase, partial [Casimicrobiaceae bacterium]
PFDCPSPWSLMHDPRDVPLPRHRQPDLDRRPWWYRASVEGTPTLADPEMRNLRAKVSRMPHQSDRQLAHMTANYYGMIALVDHNVGHLLATLDDLGMRDDTLVIFTTDHGDMLGNHGMYLKGPWPLEDLLRVGMIASGPGVAPGQVVDVPVSTLDITPTLCDATGANAELPLQGKSLLPLLAGHEDPRPCAYSEWTVHPSRCGIGLALRTVRTRDHKCTIELESGAGELYDLVNDPDETVNRFDDPGFSAVRRNLETLLHARPGDVCVDLPAPIGMA